MDLEPPVTPAPEDPMPSDVHGHLHSDCIKPYFRTHTDTYNANSQTTLSAEEPKIPPPVFLATFYSLWNEVF